MPNELVDRSFDFGRVPIELPSVGVPSFLVESDDHYDDDDDVDDDSTDDADSWESK